VTRSQPPRLGHVPALNGLRGVAIAAVLVFHVFAGDRSLGRGGFFGVDLFFVLSGFLITTLLLEEQEATGRISLKAFWVRRARRLLPAAGSLVVLFLLIALLAHDLAQSGLVVAGGALYAGNIVRAAAPHFELGPVGHFWSLAEEEQFYVLWPPLLIVALRRMPERRLLRFLLATAAAVALYRAALGMAGASLNRLYYAPDTHADGLVLGCAAAIYRRSGIRLPGLRLALPALAAVVAAFAFAFQDRDGLLYVLPAFNLAAVVVVLAATGPGAVSSVLAARPLVYLGVISYSLYIWHQFVRWLLGEQHPWIALPLSLLVAVGSYHLIERPFRHGPPLSRGSRGPSRSEASTSPADAAEVQVVPST
jgi:peptidoglycan/LPS O-acetylase OafA/YrhL